MANKGFIYFLGIMGAVTGINVGPIKLLNNNMYITYQLGTSSNLTVLDCSVALQQNEILQKVIWTSSDGDKEVGRYVWTHAGGNEATGLLQGVVRLGRKDGKLEFTNLRYDLAGFYACSATTEANQTSEALPWELLIVDTTANSRSEALTPVKGEKCKYSSTFSVAPIYPEPSLHSGLYSKKKGSFVEQVQPVEWKKQSYPNKTVAYSHKDVLFEITSATPFDVIFVNAVGLMKTDGTYISLTASEIVMAQFDEHGCPHLKQKAYTTIDYNSDSRTCRDEIKPPVAGDLKATVSCIDGYKAAGDEETFELICNQETWEWNSHADQFMCVLADPYGVAPDDDSAITTTCSSLLLVACVALLAFGRMDI